VTLPDILVTSDGERIEIPEEIRAKMPYNADVNPIDAGMGFDYDEERNWFAVCCLV
jgi:hypothetical protein